MNGARVTTEFAVDLAQRRPLVAEDAGIAVAVGADRATDPHVQQHALQDAQRMLGSRVLGVGLHPLELGLGAHSIDLELGDEHSQLAGRVRDDRDRALRGKEAEAREVLDVPLVEEHVTGEPQGPSMLPEPLASRLQLRRRDAGDDAIVQLHRQLPFMVIARLVDRSSLGKTAPAVSARRPRRQGRGPGRLSEGRRAPTRASSRRAPASCTPPSERSATARRDGSGGCSAGSSERPPSPRRGRSAAPPGTRRAGDRRSSTDATPFIRTRLRSSKSMKSSPTCGLTSRLPAVRYMPLPS